VVFKELLDIDDFVGDRVEAMAKRIQGKVRNRLDRGSKVEEVFSPEYFNQPVKTFFSTMALAETPRQVNPVDMFGSMTKTTVMGEGGIQSAHGVPTEARMLENSHVGFLDPLHTPEGQKTGISLHLALAAGKKGREPTTLVRSRKTGKLEEKTAAELAGVVVAFPDQFIRTKNGEMIPVAKKVSALDAKNEVVQVDAKDVDYVIPTSKAMFSVAANLIPFLQSNSGPRVSYAEHHMEQALALKHREQPLVASSTGSETGPRTFEDLVGGYFVVKAPVDGKVVRVAKDHISVRGTDGKLYREPLYDHYPLNEKSAFLQSEPTVKAGDTVKQGDLLADEVHTKGGQLALGVNLKVGYFPFFSDTYDDAIAISESCAEKLTSEHMYKEALDLEEGVVVDKRKFRALYRDRMTDKQAEILDDDGVIKEGTVVQPDDVLVAALKKRTPTEEELLVKGIGKSLVRPFSDISIRWESQYPGKVTRVVRSGDRIQVHIESEEPAGVGDKLCYDGQTEVLTRRGWLPFVQLTMDDEVLTYKSPEDTSHKRSTADGYVEWQKPTRLVRFGYQGDLYCVRTADVDLRVTPDHNMFVKMFGKKHQEVRQNRFQLLPAKRIVGKRVGYAVYAANPKTAGIPEWIQHRGLTLPARPFMTVLSYVYRADSTLFTRASQELVEALKACDLKYTLRLGDVGRPGLVIVDKLFRPFKQGDLPRFLDDLPTDELRKFLKRIFQTRADVTSGEQRGTVYLVHKVPRELADRYLELGVRARLAFDVSPASDGSLVQIRLRMFPSFRPPCTVEANTNPKRPDDWWDSTGESLEQVYCCTVPNGVLVVRRNWKVVLSGNSGRHGNKGVVACYDDQTEIFTDSGWKRFEQLADTDRVAVMLEDGAARFERPVARMAYDYDGEMLGCQHKYLDYLVTPNHRMFVRIENYRDALACYRVRRADDVHGKRVTHQVATHFVREASIGDRFTLPVQKNGRGRQCALTYDTLDFFSFMGWYLAEGSLAAYQSDSVGAKGVRVRSYKVQISQSREVNPDACRQIEDLLTRMGFGWHYSGSQYTFSHKGLYTYLLPLGLSHEKYVPERLFDAPNEALARLLWAYLAGDGHGYTQWHNWTAHTTSKRLVDDMQRIVVLLGGYATVYPLKPREGQAHPQYLLSLRQERDEVGVGTPEETYYAVPYKGKVHCVMVSGTGLIYVRRNGKPLWCGNSVLPDDQMPRTADGPLDIILNPLGVPSRINVGAPLETSLAKVADKTGEQIAVSSFEPEAGKRLVHVKGHYRTVKTAEGEKKVYVEPYSYERDYTAQVDAALRAEGIEAKEEVLDPVSGKSFGKVLVGRQYTIKHVHQSEKKLAARSGGPGFDYDANMAPKSSGHGSGQSMGELGLYGLLSHGATNLIREGVTLKSDAKQDDVWSAIQSGEPIPQPKPSFAYGKFLALLASMGVNVDKSGGQLSLQPLTDDDVKKMSNGELTDPTLMLRAKDLKPEAGGLFDEKVTGGIKGDRWCFIGDTKVETENGPVSIRDLVESRLPVKVLSYDFTTKQLVYRQVVARYQRYPDGTGRVGTLVYRHRVLGDTCLVGTPEHKVMTAAGERVQMADATEVLTLEK